MGRPDGSRADDQAEPDPNLFQRIGHHVQSKTLTGLLELLPLLVTIVLILFIVDYADNFIRPLAFVADHPWDFPGIGLIAAVVVFYLAGLLVSIPLGRRAMSWKSEVLSRIPVIKTIFGVTQRATTALTSQYNFSRVVFLEWPREGMIALGFVTGRVRALGREDSLVIVYIPTVPNPTSGNMALVAEDDVMETDLTAEDAMKLVFSGGIVLPQAVSLARVPRVRTSDREFIGRFESDTH